MSQIIKDKGPKYMFELVISSLTFLTSGSPFPLNIYIKSRKVMIYLTEIKHYFALKIQFFFNQDPTLPKSKFNYISYVIPLKILFHFPSAKIHRADAMERPRAVCIRAGRLNLWAIPSLSKFIQPISQQNGALLWQSLTTKKSINILSYFSSLCVMFTQHFRGS